MNSDRFRYAIKFTKIFRYIQIPVCQFIQFFDIFLILGRVTATEQTIPCHEQKGDVNTIRRRINEGLCCWIQPVIFLHFWAHKIMQQKRQHEQNVTHIRSPNSAGRFSIFQEILKHTSTPRSHWHETFVAPRQPDRNNYALQQYSDFFRLNMFLDCFRYFQMHLELNVLDDFRCLKINLDKFR